MKNILISGPLLSNSGYGVHSRQVFEYIISSLGKNNKVYCNITNWGNTSWHLSNSTTSGSFEKILECFIPESQLNNVLYDECYSIDYPSEWILIGKRNIGITAGVETDIAPSNWVDFVNKTDLTIVPSEFSRKAFIKSSELSSKSLTSEIYVIPEYFYESFTEENKDLSKDFLSDIKTDNNLLVIGQITSLDSDCDRKNIINTIESSARILSNVENSSLILKLNAGNNSEVDFIKTRKLILPVIENIKHELKENSPKFYLLHGNLSEEELRTLYQNKTSALLCLSRGEGFGLTLLEAAACGCPIIATNYSAYTEFLGDRFIKVDYSLDQIPTKKSSKIFVKNSKWANFSNKSLHQGIINFFNNKDKYANISKDLQDFIVNNYNKQVILDKYRKCLA